MASYVWHSRRRVLYYAVAILGSVYLTYWFASGKRKEGDWVDVSRLEQSVPEETNLPRALGPPPEYQFQSEDQRVCEQVYGIPYLNYIATHQQPYCLPDSPSALQCFSAPRLQAPWQSDRKNDTFCVAQGVHFGTPKHAPANGKEGATFSMQCQARNLTHDALTSASKAEELAGFPELDKMPTYWHDTGIGPTLRSWHLDSETKCTKAKSNREWILVARREDTTNIWHQMMEIWQARHTIDALQMSINPATGEPWLTPEQTAEVAVVFEDDREQLLDRLWTIVTGSKPSRMSALAPGTCFGNVIIPLAGPSSPFWTALLENIYHETCLAPALLTTWVRRVFDFLKIPERTADDVHAEPRITIVERAHNRKFFGLDDWVKTLRERHPKSIINVVDLAELTLEEQLTLVKRTDVLVAYHGAGLVHTLFLPPEAAVVEILPPAFPTRGFRSVARMRGLSHFGVSSMWAEDWNLTVHGVPTPPGWMAPIAPVHWQTNKWTYMTDDQFLGIVDAAVRNQQNKRYQFAYCTPNC